MRLARTREDSKTTWARLPTILWALAVYLVVLYLALRFGLRHDSETILPHAD